MKTCFFLISLTISTCLNCFGQEVLKINTSKSKIKWIGEYTFYFGGHNGNIQFKNGHFLKSNDVIMGGEFIIDMNSITCNDIEVADANESLVNHLKNEDFFNVSKFPTSKLVIHSVKYEDKTHMTIHADLTIKGITHPIVFQAEANYEKQQLTTKFKIDRMKWGVSYNGQLRDGAISDAIGFEVTLSL